MNITQALKYGAEALGERGSNLDLEVVLAYVLELEKEDLVREPEKKIDPYLLSVFKHYVVRLREGEPVAYMTGEKEFYGLSFFVDSRVLIPRPETEQIVDRVLDFLRARAEKLQKPYGFRLLDVGTGSANMPVAICRNFEEDLGYIDQFDAVEYTYDAIEVAKVNVGAHSLEDKVHVFQSDLLDFVSEGDRYDVIVANLPYIGEVENRFVSKDTEKFEPNVALFGGHNGLELYKKMFQQLCERNIEFDLLIGEFGFAQGEAMSALLNKYFEHKWKIEKDLSGIERIFVVS